MATVGIVYTPVLSTTLAAVGYDPATATLGVRFLNGSEYHYFEVPPDVFTGFFTAASLTGHLNHVVKRGGYRYARVA